MPDGATRARQLQHMFATLTHRVYIRHGGDCYTVDAHEGAAVWAPPGHEHITPADAVRVLPGWIKALGWRELLRSQRGVAGFEKVHPSEPHYYLPFVGVAPASQGRGLGTALLAPVLEKCDRERRPAYLEATTVASRTLYERLGFLTLAEEHLPAGGPPFWPMWRPPAT